MWLGKLHPKRKSVSKKWFKQAMLPAFLHSARRALTHAALALATPRSKRRALRNLVEEPPLGTN